MTRLAPFQKCTRRKSFGCAADAAENKEIAIHAPGHGYLIERFAHVLHSCLTHPVGPTEIFARVTTIFNDTSCAFSAS